MEISYNVMQMLEAFEKLRTAKKIEIEALEQMHRVELDDAIEMARLGNQKLSSRLEERDEAEK